MRSSAVVLGDGQLHGRVATLEVRADRRDEDAELILVSRLHANDIARGDHERADVERGARAERRNPVGVSRDDLLDGIDELVDRERRHDEALSGVVHALGVQVGTEAHNRTIFGRVGLQAFENLLAVMEDAGVLAEREGMILGQATLFPCAVLVIAHVAVIAGHVVEPKVAPIKIFLRHEVPPLRLGFRYCSTLLHHSRERSSFSRFNKERANGDRPNVLWCFSHSLWVIELILVGPFFCACYWERGPLHCSANYLLAKSIEKPSIRNASQTE